jgi:arabinose-5-phosphate isomerase
MLNEILEEAVASIRQQADELLKYAEYVDQKSFFEALEYLNNVKGKVVITGVGKSGHIGNKIAATLSSTGTPSLFMHPTEALHGDLGVLSETDIVIAIGKSGESDELNAILPVIRKRGIVIISITSNPKSTLAKFSDVNLFYTIDKEACPNNLAPTTSTTLTLVIGDAIAISLMKMKEFGKNDFAKHHPGGLLGRRLLLKVEDILINKSNIKTLDINKSTIENVLELLTSEGLGLVVFVKGEQVEGILTDGDIRRLLGTYRESFLSIPIADVINPNFAYVNLDMKAYDLLLFMENRDKPLNVVIVLDDKKRFVGIVRLHELYKLLN